MKNFSQNLCVLAALSLASVVAAPATFGKPLSASKAESPGSFRQMNHISVQVLGTEGSPVILIPGLSSPRAAWNGIAPGLTKKHRVYLVQINGFGGDDPRSNLKPGILNGVLADINTLIRERKLKDVSVVGHSMGGLLGLMLATRHPESLRRLMVVDSLPFFAAQMAPPGTKLSVAMIEPQAAKMRDAVAASYGKPADSAAADAQVGGMTLKPEHRAQLKAWAIASDPRVAAQVMYENLTTDMRPGLAAIRVPVTVVYAWNEKFPRKDRADVFFRSEYSGLKQASFSGVGPSAHFVMLDQPETFAAYLAKFLAR
ncbi:MAG TPA: alpha/beta hydrolase [Allosphingosinicella sp.]|nr:alpha/beta hydrolase [Allosphingosinicella sp.]